MGNSLYLAKLKPDARQELIAHLHASQHGACFICEEPIDLGLHGDSVDIDHVVPLVANGKDDPTNFALCHASCNRSKQAANLKVARLLARFGRLTDEVNGQPNRPNLADVLRIQDSPSWALPIELRDDGVTYCFPELGRQQLVSAPIYRDQLADMRYFFALIPVNYLTHDERINPRAISAGSLRRLIEEFEAGYPQLHAGLAWTAPSTEHPRSKVRVFDGQHKVAAQILLGVRELPLRVFVDPDFDRLLTANTHAGTTLRQVAFDVAVQRRLGSQLYADRISRYLEETGKPTDYRDFSEKDLTDHFKGQWREVRRYIIDDVRDSVTHHPDSRLKSYVDFSGKGTERPLSYSAIEKTFYSFFIYQDVLTTPLDFRLQQGENPRELEKEQLVRLMNCVADLVYIGRYDPGIGTYRLENQVGEGKPIPPEHLVAFRLGKEEILFTWLRLVDRVVRNYFIMQGRVVEESRLFQYRFPEPLWELIEHLIANLRDMPVWANTALATTVFGGKRTHPYWQTIFETGRTPDGQQVLAEPMDVMKLIK